MQNAQTNLGMAAIDILAGVLRISSRAEYWSELSCEVRLSIFMTLFTAASALPLAVWCPGDEVL